MIIGVTGTIGSGKGVFSKMLAEEGFVRLAFGDVVREEAERRGLGIGRDTLQNLGYSLREEIGVGVWAKRLIEKIENGRDYVIDGFRYPDQVEEFLKLGGFALVAVDALERNRYERLKARGREGYPQTIEEFTDMDERDLVGYRNGNGQDTRGCFEMAGYYVHNNGTLDSLRVESQSMLERMGVRC